MTILDKEITIDELKSIAEVGFGEMVKAVVDVDLGIVAIDAELHSDLEAYCIERESKLKNLWGINYYPEMEGEDFIEYDSMINIRPTQGNNSRAVEDESIRKKIIDITNKWIKR
ncbi:hypothetical protein IH879_02150 [candidate division KSB1 bacterium]|nr:hypothetical protein [candidate division KSB1 bacterium]